MPFANVLSSSNDGAMGDTGIVLQSPTFTPYKRIDIDMVYILLAFYGVYIPLVAETYQKRRGETQSTDNLPLNGRRVLLKDSNDLFEAVVGGIHWDKGSCFQSVQSVRESHGCKCLARCLSSRWREVVIPTFKTPWLLCLPERGRECFRERLHDKPEYDISE
jgi:hypothetical protein